jgi:DNA mismatch repair ATPase MutL
VASIRSNRVGYLSSGLHLLALSRLLARDSCRPPDISARNSSERRSANINWKNNSDSNNYNDNYNDNNDNYNDNYNDNNNDDNENRLTFQNSNSSFARRRGSKKLRRSSPASLKDPTGYSSFDCSMTEQNRTDIKEEENWKRAWDCYVMWALARYGTVRYDT